MTTVETSLERLRSNRALTVRFLDHLAERAGAEARHQGIERDEAAARLLAVVPGGGEEGSVGWNLMHVAVCEEACCSPLPPKLWERFGQHAAPAAFAAPLGEIAERLAATRNAMLERVTRWLDSDLDIRAQGSTLPELTRRQLLDTAVWHEPHHLTVCYDILRRHFSGE